jgi:ribosomal protein L29
MTKQKNNIGEYRKKSEKELVNELRKLKADLTKSKVQLATGKIKNTNVLSPIKKEVARIKTVLKEFKILKSNG